MLSGCPDCGGNKFQFRPAGAKAPEEPAAEPPDPPGPDSSVARTVGNAAATVRDWMGSDQSNNPSVSTGTSDPVSPSNSQSATSPGREIEGRSDTHPPDDQSHEDAAQADARRELVTKDELPDPAETHRTTGQSSTAGETQADGNQPTDAESGRTIAEQAEDRPDLEQLREELNDQFESIRVLKPGHYELNLMELYDREEYIIALQEDGRYTIQVPDRWRNSE
jgi:hypothetical protein